MKKGQISSVIIVGLVVLLLIAALLYVVRVEVDARSTPNFHTALSVFPVDGYIQGCLEQSATELLKNASVQGGTLTVNPLESFTTQNGTFQLHATPTAGNAFVSKERLAQEMSTALVPMLDYCINLSVYEDRGYTVKNGSKSVKVIVSNDQINFALTFPLTLVRDYETLQFSSFTAHISTAIGEDIDIARKIINTEIQDGYVDLDYVRAIYPQIKIQKDMPYYYSVYALERKNTLFQFGREYGDDVSKLQPLIVTYGSCRIGTSCFAGAQESSCLATNGSFSTQQCPEEIQVMTPAQIGSKTCSGWYDAFNETYIFETKVTGESWCTFEPGVGGRFYKQSCVNGEVVTEPCKDFRREICVQETAENKTFALCRDNRFSSCSECTAENCCANAQKRDCVWTNSACIPAIKPGIPFWDASAKQQCDAYSCRTDCGSAYNAFGDYSGKNAVRSVALASLTTEYERFKNASLPRVISSPVPFVGQSEITYSMAAEFTRALAELDATYDNSAAALCAPWLAPSIDQCEACSRGDYRSCTEYKCRSLGASCVFRSTNGTPTCFAANPTNDLTVTVSSPHTENGITTASVYDTLNFTITTDQPAFCKVDYLPKTYYEMTGTDLTRDPAIEQQLLLPIYHDYSILSDFAKLYGNSPNEIITSLVGIQFTEFTYVALEQLSVIAAGQSSTLQELLGLIAEGKMKLFVSCIDKTGTRQGTAETIIAISDSCAETAPKILSTYFASEKLEVYTNVPASCRYSDQDLAFTEMENTMSCEKNVFNISSMNGGSYACETKTSLSTVFVRCANNPALDWKEAKILINKTTEGTTPQLDLSSYVNNNTQATITLASDSDTSVYFGTHYRCGNYYCSLQRCEIPGESTGEIMCEPVMYCDSRAEQQTSTQVTSQNITELQVSYDDITKRIVINTTASACGITVTDAEGLIGMTAKDNAFEYDVGTYRPGEYNAQIVCIGAIEQRQTFDFTLT